ncbi:MAG: ParA family protein [Ignavibacteriae bacterium]|nr:ParA family protein [Ignavibacteriota bacterium]
MKTVLPFKFISVESRKGGVGKTTAALNLAKIFKNSGYVVLLIDIDITGTNIIYDLRFSSFWKDETNSLELIEDDIILDKYLKEGESDKYKANLLDIYERFFMCGKALPDWKISDKVEKKTFSIKLNKINVIGSEIYNVNNSVNPNRLICNPSILFDELHSFWFVEFLKDICKSFINVTKGEKTVIIFDNSPGFVGVNPTIQEWLTDVGPEISKFLTVTSLDKQDLISCEKAIEELQFIYESKYNAAKEFRKAKLNKNQDIDIKKNEENFFIRIASDSLTDEMNYYEHDDNKKFINDLNKYQDFIINKVPKYWGNLINYDYDITKATLGNSKIINKILNNDFKKISKKYVYFDNYISNQFIESSLTKSTKRGDNSKRLSLAITKIENDIKRKTSIEEYNWEYIDKSKKYYLINNKINFLQVKLTEVIEKLNLYNYPEISGLIENDWYPKAPFETVKQYLSELSFDREYYYEDIELNEMDSERMYNQFINIENIINERISIKSRNIFLNNFEYLFSFKTLIFIFLAPIGRRYPIYEEFIELFTVLLSYQINKFIKLTESEKKIVSLQKFLANEIMKDDDIKNYELKFLFHGYRNYSGDKESFISEFYNAFCKAQSRLIDLDNDFGFLIYVIRKATFENKNEELKIFPYIRDILNAVIINKTVSRSEARKSVEKGFASAKYMANFEDVLKDILKRWEVKL